MTTAADPEARLGWLAFTIDEALRLGVMQPAHLLSHVTPEVLAERLPRELMVKVFASAFSTGKLTPEGILAVAPPATLVRHVAPAILWASVRTAAERNQLGTALPKGATPARTWLASVIAAGLERGMFTPADVTRHVPPSSWVTEVPSEVVSGLIGLGLAQPAFDPSLVLHLLTPKVLGEHVAPRLTWGIVDEGAERAFELASAA
jgi:hypothetical protein